MERYEFYVITMSIKNGFELYLEATNDGKYGWNKDLNEAIWFDSELEAESFSNKYFKNFKDWKIKEIKINI